MPCLGPVGGEGGRGGRGGGKGRGEGEGEGMWVRRRNAGWSGWTRPPAMGGGPAEAKQSGSRSPNALRLHSLRSR